MSEKNKIDLTDEQTKRLLNVICEDEKLIAGALHKAIEWRVSHDQMLTAKNIIDAVEVAQWTLAEDFAEWDAMQDGEKNDLAEMMCGLAVARDLLADMFGMKTWGRVECEVEE